jgi:hypothetical protein
MGVLALQKKEEEEESGQREMREGLGFFFRIIIIYWVAL